jgi:hypothetical protein
LSFIEIALKMVKPEVMDPRTLSGWSELDRWRGLWSSPYGIRAIIVLSADVCMSKCLPSSIEITLKMVSPETINGRISSAWSAQDSLWRGMWCLPFGTRAKIAMSADVCTSKCSSCSIEITLEMTSLEAMDVRKLSGWGQTIEGVKECGAHHVAQEP